MAVSLRKSLERAGKACEQEKQSSEAGRDLVTETRPNYSAAGAGWTRKKNIDSGMSEQGLEAAGSRGTTWPEQRI